jgi:hypothetical protein
MFFVTLCIGLLPTIVADLLNANQHSALLNVYNDIGEWAGGALKSCSGSLLTLQIFPPQDAIQHYVLDSLGTQIVSDLSFAKAATSSNCELIQQNFQASIDGR